MSVDEFRYYITNLGFKNVVPEEYYLGGFYIKIDLYFKKIRAGNVRANNS